MLNENEIEKLLEIYIVNAEEEIDEDKCMKLVEWAQQARIDSILLDMVLSDKINVARVISENEISFSNKLEVSQKFNLTKELDDYLDQKFLSDM